MTESLTTAEVLNRAADLIEKRGWNRVDGFHGGDVDGPLCLEGALHAASGIPPLERLTTFLRCDAYAAVWRFLETDPRWEQTYYHSRLYDWNDAPDRTADEVIAVLRAAALLESTRDQVRILHGPTAADALLAKHGQVRA